MSRKSTRTPWIITSASVGLAVALLLLSRRDALPQHPEPRSDAVALATTVVPASVYRAYPRAQRAYRIAREIPTVLDGMYCHCRCRENFEHRSLLTCFQSDHGAACDICITEAEIANQMVSQGRTLDDVREAVDRAFAR